MPPGQYVYSGFHSAPLKGQTVAFGAVAGRANYIGDFIYSEDKVVHLRRSAQVAEQALTKLFPRLGPKFSLAETVSVRRPTLFLCMR